MGNKKFDDEKKKKIMIELLSENLSKNYEVIDNMAAV